jgi:sugar fermentation stimulation protein A
MIHYKQDLVKAHFLARPNRFIALCELDVETVRCHMPNPGRMWELLFPGVVIYLRRAMQPGRKTPYEVVGIERDGVPIMMDTQYNNDIAAYLVENKKIPGWESWDLIRREVTVGDSRFDLLLGRGSERFYVEVKSCTLFSRHGAMFPDAVTERGRKHIAELAQMTQKSIHAGVLFLVHWDKARWFLPDYHTDPDFAATFREAAKYLDWKALALRWDNTFTLPKVCGLLAYHPEILDRENHDSGDYFVVLSLSEDRDIKTGSLGLVHYPKGYYVYVGSARKNLAARLARHQRKRKNFHWHIDYLRQEGNVEALVPVRTADDLEEEMAEAVSRIADFEIKGFGATDKPSDSHLFGFSDNPIHRKDFMQVVEDFRMNRLDDL